MATEQKIQDLGEVHICAEAYVIYQGNVLMHRRSMNKKHFPGYLLGPGGHVNEGEDVVAAACREVEEETGIIVPPETMKLKFVSIHHHIDTHTVWISWGYLSEPPTISGALKQSDEGTSEWIEFNELMSTNDNVFPPSREYFDHVLHNIPGILYTSSEWENNNLLRTLSKTVVTI